MSRRGVFVLVLLASCTRPNPDQVGVRTGEVCQNPETCREGVFQLCVLGAQCRLLANDGSSFECASCDDCTTAQIAIVDWCAGSSSSVSGASGTNGSTSGTNGSTNGTNGSSGTNGSTSGGGGSTTGSGGTGSGGGTTGPAQTCDQCANDSESGACADASGNCDSDCSDLLNCVGACAAGDLVCQQTCWNGRTAAAQSAANDVLDCFCSACASECTGTCVGRVTSGTVGGTTTSTGGSTTSGSDPCGACANTQVANGGACYSQSVTCQNGSGCNQILNCLASCTTQTACDSCVSGATPAAQSKYQALNSCLCGACGSECPSQCPAS